MPEKFLQIHTLTSYPASLLNRDDVGFAKRIPFGGFERTRISSQCLKRHWRTANDENALSGIQNSKGAVPMSVRSRRTFETFIYRPLVDSGVDDEMAKGITEEILTTLFPAGKARGQKGDSGGSASIRTDQVTILGRPEIEYLKSIAEQCVADAAGAAGARKTFQELYKGELKKNLRALTHSAGLDAALFGRMTTGDILARCDAAIHVAHSFSVHEGDFETDYFSAVDDLQPKEETGSGHINTSELSSGLFYGYAVIDLPLLVSNLEGCERGEWASADRALASEVVRRFVHLVATISPGAKLGSTAPYAYSSLVLIEVSNRQPRTLANAFIQPVRSREGLPQEAIRALALHLNAYDRMYGKDFARKAAILEDGELLNSVVDEQVSINDLADWAAACVKGD